MRRSLALPFFPALGLLMMVLVPIQARGPQAPAATSAPAAPAAPAGQLLVNASWLAQHLQDPDLVVLHLGDQAGYDAGHIPGARLVAMNDVLVDTDTHLLEMPAPDELRRRLAALGVSDRSRIVVYWARDWVSPATRIVFTLDYAGMGSRTSLLDGGMPAWVKDGHPLSTDRPAPRSGTLSPLTIQPLVVNAAFVRDHLSKPGYAVVDGRARALYDGSQRGGTRGRPHRTGHIAGARSIPYSELTDEALAVRSADRLRAVFSAAGVQPGDTVIGYCHLGQQATAMLFAARLLGHRVLLYDGSFEDWSRHPDYAVENPGAGGPTGRALTIEDYYRLQAVGAPAISPDGRWVSFTVSTRIEDDNTTQTATWIGPADATARPQRVSHFGRDITGARWDESNRLIYTVGTDRWTLDPAAPARLPVPASAAPEGEPSPDGTWTARRPGRSNSVTTSASRVRSSTGRTSSATARRFRRPTSAPGPPSGSWWCPAAAAIRACSWIATSGRAISRGTPTARASSSRLTPRGATNSPTSARTSGRSRSTARSPASQTMGSSTATRRSRPTARGWRTCATPARTSSSVRNAATAGPAISTSGSPVAPPST